MPSATSGRVLFVDLARAAAVVFMVQGHTLAVLLAPGYEETVPFKGWLYLRGLTSCLFLLLSGFSFMLATDRHLADYVTPTPRLRRRLARFTIFLLLGYAMRIPVRPLSRLPGITADQWLAFGAVDILQLVAITLLALQGLTWLLGTRRRVGAVAGVLAASMVLLTPPAWNVAWSRVLPSFVAAYLSPATGSLFPLFPWAAYILLGVALGAWFLERRDAGAEASTALALLGAGAAMIVAGVAFYLLPFSPYGPIDFWKNSPNLFLVKGGSVLVLVAGAVVASRRLGSLPQPVTALARESLTIYFVHLCLLYGSIWNDGLFQRIGPHLGLPATLVWAVMLVAAMVLLASGWFECKRRWRAPFAVVRAGLAFAALYAIA